VFQEKLARLAVFVIMEPPVVAPHLYAALPELTAAFDRVYVHNVDGDGYSLDGVQRSKLHKLYWPIPYNDVLEPFWGQKDRARRIVVINGSHNPRSRTREQYSTRIEAMVELSKFGVVDLDGGLGQPCGCRIGAIAAHSCQYIREHAYLNLRYCSDMSFVSVLRTWR
jgi:hypothetical protein